MKFITSLLLAILLFTVIGLASEPDAAWEAKAKASFARVYETYPEAADHDGPFFVLMMEVDEAWRVSRDPRYFVAEKPELLAQVAFEELELARLERQEARRQESDARALASVMKKRATAPMTIYRGTPMGPSARRSSGTIHTPAGAVPYSRDMNGGITVHAPSGAVVIE